MPTVAPDSIPADIRQVLAQNNIPVESMTNEARMSIKLMASVEQAAEGGDNILGPNRGSVKQATMEEILMRAQKVYQMSKNEQVAEV